ncbi:predicted protein [Naegleria gruberi]|uniref:Predicted protein n=1 Tax=Naegleria gruberi TaxID=5762 RepID=D2VWY1_NAEGR|nr:uncharacterized protein NAEGRDRAFT_73544 [Naegleria gruberi]EFC38707.1 predicted protein [Naegleria gruberi]|eukprot:XP_002671451.1 predicted protein [Naegleria gruberi strain NEG-M]
MKYENLGNTGLKVSKICLGCMSFGSPKWFDWVLEESESMIILKKAWELGINFFDTANIYSNGESERILGKFIRENNIPREEVVIATKVFGPVDKSGEQRLLLLSDDKKVNTHGLSRKHIMHAVEESLERLGTDYIDLYIIHRWDPDTPIEETMETLHDLVKSGKVRYIGASSMFAWQFAKAQHYADKKGLTKFISMQNLYHLLYREEERDMIPMCLDQKVSLTPYSPLAKGILARAHEFVNSEKTSNDEDDDEKSKRANSDFIQKQFKETMTEGDKENLRRVSELANKKNVSPAQIAIAWLLKKPGVTSPIVGATKVSNIESSIAALDIELTPEEVKYLDESYTAKAPHAVGVRK